MFFLYYLCRNVEVTFIIVKAFSPQVARQSILFIALTKFAPSNKKKKKLENKAHIIATNTSKNRFFVFILFLRKQTFKNVLGIFKLFSFNG